MDVARSIDTEEHPEERKKIIDVIGAEAYAKLVNAFGGTLIYVHKKDGAERLARNEEIRLKFNGKNYTRLALEYNLTEVMIRQIVADVDKEMRTKQIDGQEGLFPENQE